MKNNSASERLFNGLIKENPTFILALGMCPTLAVTTSAMNGLGMGLTTTVVLALSNLIISLLRKIIPVRVRIPAFIVIVASFVTMVQLLLQAYLPSLNDSLGVYIPLIVVNCIILGRAESYAYHNPVIASLFDGIGMGLGFSVALTIIGAVRELLGKGDIFGYRVMPSGYVPISIFVLAPGAFFVLAMLTALQNYLKSKAAKRGKDVSKVGSGCTEDCMNCGDKGCSKRFYDADAKAKAETENVEAEAVKVEAEAPKTEAESVMAEDEAVKAEAEVGKTEAETAKTDAETEAAEKQDAEESVEAESASDDAKEEEEK